MREREVEALVRPVVEASELEVWEVSFGREAGGRILRVMVDRKGGVARIPIERAMDLLVAKGLPARDKGAAPRPNAETKPEAR